MNEFEYDKSLEEYQEKIYHRRYNAEADLEATRTKINDLKEEIERKKSIIDELEKKLIQDESIFFHDFST